ncbi:RING-H2 finger protein ATL56-like [Senna tora]|uniref:RING-type E3 ubiquitin transferase n=1 Tax=Senna tora TaxID=362788 RepID=A0A834SRJ5_9FABA|nr:RING-H2 finger protein ATL56-like [Senna tora]
MEIVICLILLFLGIAVLVLIHVCMVWRAFGGGSEEQSGGGGGGDGIVRKRMCREELKNLPCFEYKEGKKGGDGSLVDCAVCLESFKVGDLCRFLPMCRHTFHVPCIDSWILNTPICPICRTWVHLIQQVDVSDNVRIQVV